MVVSFSSVESTRTRAEVQAQAGIAVQAKRFGEAAPIFAAAPAAGVGETQRVQAEPTQARLGQSSTAHPGL